MDKKRFSIIQRVRSFKYAFAGLKALFENEHNAWIHAVAAIGVVVGGLVFKISVIEWLIVLLCIALVFMAELFNSAIEQLCNTVTTDFDQRIKNAKDLGAAAVLVVAIFAAIVGAIIFVPKIIALF